MIKMISRKIVALKKKKKNYFFFLFFAYYKTPTDFVKLIRKITLSLNNA